MADPFASFDLTGWPLAIITFRGTTDDAGFEAYLERVLSLYDIRERFVLVVDATHAGILPPAQRRRQAHWMRDHHALISRYCTGIAFVIDSVLVRGVLTAILWAYPIPAPSTVMATRGAAIAWAEARRRDRDVA